VANGEEACTPRVLAMPTGRCQQERGSQGEIRRQIDTAGSIVRARINAESDLTRSLQTVLSTAEDRPSTPTCQNFPVLQEVLRSTENRIVFARQHYNDSVVQYNTALSTTNLVAQQTARCIAEVAGDSCRVGMRISGARG
jgi:LemA protein